MSQTPLPTTKGSAATGANGSSRCPGCGRPFSYVMGTMGGSGYYQPCGCYAGEMKG